MLLWNKMDQAMKQYHEKQAEKEEAYRNQYGEEGRKLERGDLFAMLLSAFLVIVPAVLGVILLMVGVAYFALLH